MQPMPTIDILSVVSKPLNRQDGAGMGGSPVGGGGGGGFFFSRCENGNDSYKSSLVRSGVLLNEKSQV